MLDLAKSTAPGVEQLAVLDLPDDPVPSVDAIVGVGHALNYLSSAEQITEAVRSLGKSLRPGGVVALDVCDLAWGPAHTAPDNLGRVGEDWAIISRFSTPSPDRYVREMTTFVTNSDGSWRRDDERHDNVLVDVSVLAGVFDEEGVHVEVGDSFGQETLPIGLRTIIGSRPG
jgi:hypothetical protein